MCSFKGWEGREELWRRGNSREQNTGVERKSHTRESRGSETLWGGKDEYAREQWGECEIRMSRECVRERKLWQSGREGNEAGLPAKKKTEGERPIKRRGG